MPRNRREPWLDWNNSLAEVKEIKRKRNRNKSIKSLFWARFWLVLGLGFFSNLYLRRSLPAFLWLLILFVYSLFSSVLSKFAKGLSSIDLFLVTMVNLMLYLLMIRVEWVQLPKRVRKLNAGVVGENNLDNDELRGKIGRYAILKKHTYALLIIYTFSLLAFEIEENMSSIYTNILSICLLIMVQVLAFSYLYRAYKLSQQSDINLESRDK
jgi:hypothetical protein